MDEVFPDAKVIGFESLELGISLPDKNDKHVVAAARKCKADLILSYNLNDFPKSELSKFGLEAIHPDEFLAQLIQNQPIKSKKAFMKQIGNLRNPPLSKDQVLDKLQQIHLWQTVDTLRSLL